MKIKEIIVDKVPESCWECVLHNFINDDIGRSYPYCFILAEGIDQMYFREERKENCLLKEGREGE